MSTVWQQRTEALGGIEGGTWDTKHMQDVRKYFSICFAHYTVEDPCLRISIFRSIGLCETSKAGGAITDDEGVRKKGCGE